MMIVASITIAACAAGEPDGVEITSLDQLRAAVEISGAECDDLTLIPAQRYASESALCDSDLLLSVIPERLDMGPVLQAAHSAARSGTGTDLSVVAFGDTWIVSCGTQVEVCDSIAESLSGGVARRES